MYEPHAPRLVAPNAPPAVPSRGAAPSASAATVDAVVRILERLEQVIEGETLALQERRNAELADFNHRKSHGLLELSRAIRTLNRSMDLAAIEPQLATLRDTLDRNHAVLKTHVAAVSEISTLVARAIRDSESDGTYGESLRRGYGS
jgi:hypothetical protein